MCVFLDNSCSTQANIIYLTRQMTDTDDESLDFMRINYPYGPADREFLIEDAFHYEQVRIYIYIYILYVYQD